MHRRVRRTALVTAHVMIFGWFAAGSPLPAYGQEASENQTEEQGEEETREDQPTWLVRKLQWMEDKVSSGEEPEYPRVFDVGPVLGGLQSGASITAGLRVVPYETRHFISAVDARASVRKYWGVQGLLGYEWDRFVAYGYGRYRHMPEEDYYGIESFGLAPERTSYRLDEGVAGALFGIAPARRLLVGLHASYLANWLGPGRDDDFPTVGEVFTPSNTPGLGESIHYAMWGAFIEFDSRDLPYERAYGRRFALTQRRMELIALVPTRGIYFTAEHRRYLHVDGSSFGFNELEFDSEQFLPLQRGKHVFAFREYMLLTYSEGDNQVPFYMMPALGGSRTLRGFAHERFRDQNALLGNFEYRYLLWDAVQLALFTDAGYVFRDMDALDLADPELGYGLGIRVMYGLNVPLRIDVARSREDSLRLYVRLHSFF